MTRLAPGVLFVDRYRVDRLLGEGGAGTVYRAVDRRTGREVALKVLFEDAHGQQPKVLARFQREVKIIAGLGGPHTVQLLDAGESDGLLYFVYEYLEGRDLEQVIAEDAPLGTADTIAILRQIAASLGAAHDLGLLHRDVKPANVRVYSPRGAPYQVKVLDFGIARSFDSSVTRITSENALLGTPHFMAPEQIKGEDLTPAVDVYALGLVAIELLTGRPAVQDDSIQAILHQHVNVGVSLPANFPVAPTLRRLVDAMCDRSPTERPRSMGEVIKGLDAVAPSERPLSAHSLGSAVARKRAPLSRDRKIFYLAAGVGIAAVMASIALFGLIATPTREAPPSAPTQVAAPSLSPSAPALVEPREPMARTEEADLGASDDVERSPERAGPVPTDDGCLRERIEPGAKMETVVIHGVARNVLVYRPEGLDPTKRSPAVWLFHSGRQAGPTKFFEESRFEDLADEYGFYVVAPESLTHFATGGIARQEAWSRRRVETRFLREAIPRLEERHCLDPDRRMSVGTSTGGRFLELRACDLGFRATAISSIRIKELGDNCVGLIPMLRIDGRNDPRLPYEGGDVPLFGFVTGAEKIHAIRRDEYRCSGAPTVWQEGATWTCRWQGECREPLAICVHDGGHAWPNQRPETTDGLSRFVGLGTGLPMQMPAARVVSEFFFEKVAPPDPEETTTAP